jgi:hypothetical protein
MNKSTLIDLLELAIGVTGDVEFYDTNRTLLDIAQSADLNSAVICSLVTEANAIFNVIYDDNCLPFFPVRKAGGDYLLLSDFDGQVNFKPCSNVALLMVMVRAIEQSFGKVPKQAIAPLSEVEIANNFATYSSQYADGYIISPIERSEALLSSILTQSFEKMAVTISSKHAIGDNSLDAALDSATPNKAAPAAAARAESSLLDKNDPLSIFKL